MKNQNGFTLIEVLVSAIILAIGLLGVTRLQLATMQNNNSSQHRSIAIQIASDMFERMRANPDAVLNRGYDHAATSRSDVNYTVSPSTGPCVANVCSTEDRALDDLSNAMRQAASLLPSGGVIACIDSGSGGSATYDGTTITPECDGLGNAYAVKVFWLDDRSTQGGSQAQGGYTVFVTRSLP